jgi:AraC-like DNA-binding protein
LEVAVYDLSTLFKPIISTPCNNPEQYVEIQPCQALKPYIRCFWGEPRPYMYESREPDAAIPDACIDIVFYINYSTNEITNKFCGIGDMPFLPDTGKRSGVISYFGIRFYFWAAHLFVKGGLSSIVNNSSDVEQYFPDFRKTLEGILIHHPCIEDRIYFTEIYLLNKLRNSFSENNNLMNAVFRILTAKGVISIPEVCEYVGISQRQLERIFSEYVGFSPKRAADVVRYQNVWQDLFYARTHDFPDIAYEYGYTDQAHLVNDFKKHHGKAPLEAFSYARDKMSDFYNTKPLFRLYSKY